MSDVGDVLQQTTHALLQLRSETASIALADQLVRRYSALDDDGRTTYFAFLLEELGADRRAVDDAIDAYRQHPSEQTLGQLTMTSESRRQPLFRAMNVAPGGIDVLLDMRAALLERRSTHPELAPVEHDLQHLLRSWFNRGFLELRQLDWSTPAIVLEKLIEYEAVHEIEGWTDMQRRLAPDRRSFGFFHPALPNEPVIFVEVALTTGLATSVQELLDAPTPDATPAGIDTAIFYSITNCQEGLHGISFGNFLIKQVTARLGMELPDLTTFATLSPVPGFATWLAEHHPDLDTGDRHALEHRCAEYLLTERRGRLPADPVARFHLRNGARVEQINWQGDTSAKGMKESHGLLVNYLYSGQDPAANHDLLVQDGIVVASAKVIELAGVSVDASQVVESPARVAG